MGNNISCPCLYRAFQPFFVSVSGSVNTSYRKGASILGYPHLLKLERFRRGTASISAVSLLGVRATRY